MTGPSGNAGETPYSIEGKSSEDLIRELRILWFGLLMGQVIFAGVIVVIGGSLWKEPGSSPLAGPFALILGLTVVLVIAMSLVFERAFASRLRERSGEIKQSADPLRGAYVVYRGFFIIRHALVEATGFVGLLNYLVTATTAALVIPAATISWFVLNFPTEDRVRRHIEGALGSA